MPRLFDSIQVRAPKRNKFDLSHEKKLSMRQGALVPIVIQDVVPGDQFRVSTEIMLRMAPMLAPIMHRVNVFTHYFFVPNRLVWNEWEDFITGGKDGLAAPISPFIQINDTRKDAFTEGKLPDYMGVPVTNSATLTNTLNISSLPFRAYQTIYNEYYRDQNLTDPIDINLGSGSENDADVNRLVTMRFRAWEKDYFTSALPFAQRGAEVMLPLDGVGSVTYMPLSEIRQADGTIPPGGTNNLQVDAGGNIQVNFGNDVRVENIDEVTISTSDVSINDLRRSIKLQEWLELSARAGSRYIEQIKAFFGIQSSDARLQRPEYLGGGRQPIVVSEVLQTFQDPDGTGNPLGQMGGHAYSTGSKNGFKRSFEEHGYVIGIMSVIPKTAYQQGLPRHFTRDTKFDYFWSQFANIGEQEIRNKEIYYDQTADPDIKEEIFGYQSRYAEYKYQPSTVHGAFRSSLAFWHMGRIFAAQPVLNENFVQADPTDRIYAVEDLPEIEQLYVHLYNRIDALRPMPFFGTPTL